MSGSYKRTSAIDHTTHSSEETFALGASLSKLLTLNRTLTFTGPLGAGKTTLIKGIISAFTATPEREITSPTFTYLHSYGNVHHFDLYRISGVDEFLGKGFDDYLDQMCLIEWPDRIEGLICNPIAISIEGSGESLRIIEVHL